MDWTLLQSTQAQVWDTLLGYFLFPSTFKLPLCYIYVTHLVTSNCRFILFSVYWLLIVANYFIGSLTEESAILLIRKRLNIGTLIIGQANNWSIAHHYMSLYITFCQCALFWKTNWALQIMLWSLKLKFGGHRPNCCIWQVVIKNMLTGRFNG